MGLTEPAGGVSTDSLSTLTASSQTEGLGVVLAAACVVTGVTLPRGPAEFQTRKVLNPTPAGLQSYLPYPSIFIYL